MEDIQTLDELIASLERIKSRLGGSTRVIMESQFGGLRPPSVTTAATGKSDQWKLVSRGGIPCVLIYS